VELHRNQIPVGKGGAETKAVFRSAQNVSRIGGFGIKGMDEIIFRRRQAGKDGMGAVKFHPVPAHMGDLQYPFPFPQAVGKPADPARRQAQARGVIFLAMGKDHLGAEAYPQQGRTGGKAFPEPGVHPQTAEVGHGLPGRPHAGKDDPVASGKLARIGGNRPGLAQVLEGPGDAGEVARLIVYDSYHFLKPSRYPCGPGRLFYDAARNRRPS